MKHVECLKDIKALDYVDKAEKEIITMAKLASA